MIKQLKTMFQNNCLPENRKNITGTQLRELLKKGEDIPEWFTMSEISRELKTTYKKGVCIYLIGLSGSGKSTIGKALCERLKEKYNNVTLLNGDIIREHLGQGLGFSRVDRSINVRRIGYVASLIVENGGIVICSNIAPYNDDRLYNRKIFSSKGKYIEVYINTSLEICENRDVKGLYKKVREGKIKQFTGIDDPFEPPTQSDIIISGEGNINSILDSILPLVNNDHDPNEINKAKITKFTILGERCSGTNFLEQIITKNFEIDITWNYGWKHFFGFSNYNDSDDVLFIGIVRDPVQWLCSFHEIPHHLNSKMKSNWIDFLTSECWSYDDSVKCDDEAYKEILIDRNLYTGVKYKNIFELRETKLKFLLDDMPTKVKNYILIRYEDLLYDYTNILSIIEKKFNLKFKHEKICNIDNHVGNEDIFHVKLYKFPGEYTDIFNKYINRDIELKLLINSYKYKY